MTKQILVTLVVCAAGTRADADPITPQCPNLPRDTAVTEETYLSRAYTAGDMLCDPPSGSHPGTCALQGLLYVPDGAKNAPAVVFNHGAANPDKKEESYACVVKHFLRHGFVVFLPLRRGYTMEGEHIATIIRSTGQFSSVVIDALENWRGSDVFPFPAEATPYWPSCSQEATFADRKDCVNAKLVQAETAEVGAAIRWLKKQKVGPSGSQTVLVNPLKVGIVGHSAGGKVSIFAAADLTGVEQPQAAVSLSMAEKGAWGSNVFMDAALESSAENALVPVAFFQPSNALNLKSTKKLGKKAAGNRRRYLAQVFPAVNEAMGVSVHSGFLELEEEVHRWGPVARVFFAIYGID